MFYILCKDTNFIKNNAIFNYNYSFIGYKDNTWRRLDKLGKYQWAVNNSGHVIGIRHDSIFAAASIFDDFQFVEKHVVPPGNNLNIRAANNYFYLYNGITLEVSKDNGTTWQDIIAPNIKILENFSIKGCESDIVLITYDKLLLSSDGVTFTEIGKNKASNVFCHSNKIYNYEQYSIYIYDKLTGQVSQKSFRYYIPYIFNADTKAVPLCEQTIGHSSTFTGFHASNDNAETWAKYNEGLDSDHKIFDSFTIDDAVYCINTTGLWKRSIDDFCPFTYVDDSKSQELKIEVHPNPTFDKAIIFNKSNKPMDKIRLLNYQGKIMYTNYNIHSTTYEMYIGEFPKGIYFVEVICGTQSVIKKVMVL
jgi:hypothetical protein